MDELTHKSEHGSFTKRHVQAFYSFEEFQEACSGILNHLKPAEKRDALKKIYEACKLPVKKSKKSFQDEISDESQKK